MHLHSLQLEADSPTCKNELKKKTRVTVFHRRRCWTEKRRYTIILSRYERGNIKKKKKKNTTPESNEKKKQH